MGRTTAHFLICPLGPWGGAKKVKYHSISVTKSISKIFKPNSKCLLTNERYITYQTGLSWSRLGHASGVGHCGTGGVGVNDLIFLKFDQIWCVSYSHEWHVQRIFFGGVPAP